MNTGNSIADAQDYINKIDAIEPDMYKCSCCSELFNDGYTLILSEPTIYICKPCNSVDSGFKVLEFLKQGFELTDKEVLELTQDLKLI